MFDHWVWLTPLYLIGLVEERASVRIGIRDPIVAIEVQRARIVAIVRIAEQFGTTQTALGVLPAFTSESGCKGTHLFFYSKSKSEI